LENDYNECIPEETSEDETTLNTNTIAHSTDSSEHHSFENEVSWADTLKYYSRSQQEDCSPVEVDLFFWFFITIFRKFEVTNVLRNLSCISKKMYDFQWKLYRIKGGTEIAF
jgi:plasmid replication initiation protein